MLGLDVEGGDKQDDKVVKKEGGRVSKEVGGAELKDAAAAQPAKVEIQIVNSGVGIQVLIGGDNYPIHKRLKENLKCHWKADTRY